MVVGYNVRYYPLIRGAAMLATLKVPSLQGLKLTPPHSEIVNTIEASF
jgi:hypothetical protein